ncbi:hypothetical protein Pan258_52230 [Symmachiella dynata]|uniref:MFS transporter n=1 Tax=Symmachiella dynata TaxID=2527995 RepID=UPI00118C6B34|nr:MFS transporter [Symmachiella dynata]QDT51140.1 hypothetical protein Pan258_52230 [Symmachiella dynata]
MRILCALGLAIFWGLTAQSVSAQPPTDGNKTPSTAKQPQSRSTSTAPNESSRRVIYWIDETGKRIPVLRAEPGETLEQALDRLKTDETATKPPAPQTATITRIDLSGKVIGERAALTAEYTVQVLAEDAFVPIPLRIPEATITGDAKHTGPGESIPGGLNGNDGYTWWLRGKGEHHLTLDLSLPVEARSPKLRLKLTLPPTAVSKFSLQVPQPQVSATAQNKDSRSQPVISEIDGSQIVVLGLGTAFELTWQPTSAAEPGNSVLEVDNTISVDVDNEAVFVKAQQDLKAIVGTATFDVVRVDLPANAKLQSLHGPNVVGHAADPAAPQTIIIQLAKPTLGPVKLNWLVELDHPQSTSSLLVEGFNVHEAVRQSGLIGMRSDADHRLDIDADASKFVRRIDVATVKNYFDFEAAPDSAFRFSKQPFRLDTKIRKVEPQLTVTPQILLSCSGSSIDLEGTFQFRVTGGEIETVDINWPDWQRNGWTLQPFEPQGQVAERSEEGNRITFRLKKRTGTAFTVQLKAQRAIPDEKEPLDFDLPAAEASRHQTAVVIVAMNDNVQMQFEPEGGETVARLLLEPLPVALRLPETVRDRRHIIYEVESISRRFTGRLSTHKKIVQTSTIVKLIPTAPQMTVRQTISYTVAWGRQATVSLLVPNSLKGRVRFTSDTDDELLPTPSQAPSKSDYHQINLPLKAPGTRRFHVIAEYNIDDVAVAKPSDQATVMLPFIKSLDGAFAETTFETEQSPNVQVQFEQEGWRLQTDAAGKSTWRTNRDVISIPVSTRRIGGPLDQPGVVITKALARTEIDATGTAETQLVYELQQTPDRIEITLPTGQTLVEVLWNGQKLQRESVDSNSEALDRYGYKIQPTTDRDERRLLIRYRALTSQPLAFTGSYRLSIPRITGEVWAGQSVWDVQLPREQILFIDPVGFTSQNQWTRSALGGLLWQRTPQQTPAELRQWLNFSEPSDAPSPSGGGHRYQFARLAPLRQLSVQTISWPMLIGIGSGLSLILGLMFQYVPASRNVLALLVIGCALAVVGIWYMTPVILLLQASVLGMVLAFVSAMIQASIRRRRSTVVTMSSGSGIGSITGSSFEQDVIGTSGSQTLIRPPSASGSSPGQSIPSSTISGASE